MIFLLKNIRKDACKSYDCNHAMVIRASSETHARQIASKEAFGEGPATWLDSVCSTCEVIDPNGNPEILCVDTLEG